MSIVKKDISTFIQQNLDVALSIDSSGKTRRGLQHFSLLKPQDKNTRVVYEIILSHAIRAENRCPGAGLIFLSIVSGERRYNSTPDSTRVKNKKDIKNLFDRFTSSLVRNILNQVIENCNTNSSVTLKKSASNVCYVELINSFNFNCIPLIKNDFRELLDVRVVCIDGYIESVSEIHHLLTHLSDKKFPCLLFARGISEDVLNTISVNRERNTIKLFPYKVEFNIDAVNSLVDIAVISGTDVVSSLKGDLISSIDLEKIGRLESCVLSGGSIRMKTDLQKRRINEHIANIKKTLTDRPELEEVLVKRLKSLTSSCIEVNLPDDINFYSHSQQLDEGIRIIKSVIEKSYDPERIANEIYDSFTLTTGNLHKTFLLSDTTG